MSANSNNKSDGINSEGRLVLGVQSSVLQVETLGTDHASGGLQEQIESAERSGEAADTQQVDSNDDWGRSVESSSDEDGSEDASVILPTPATRAEELQTRMKGGVHQSHYPVEGIAQAAVVLNLFGDRGESAVALRNCILGLCFRELTVEGRIVWERHVRWTTKWSSAMKALRLDMCKEEAERQGVDIPPWYLLDGVTGLQVARPYSPADDTGTIDQQENTDYAMSAPVPSCAIWNLLDTQGEEGTPSLSIADWLKFVVGRSTADQWALKRIMTKVLLRARWTENLCQALYDGWARSTDKKMSVVEDLERMTDSRDIARRKTHRVKEQLRESRDQSSDLQVEMREDLERLEDRLREANEQMLDYKSPLGRAKEAA